MFGWKRNTFLQKILWHQVTDNILIFWCDHSPSCLTIKLATCDSWLGMLMLAMSVNMLLWYTGRIAYHKDKRAADQLCEQSVKSEETGLILLPGYFCPSLWPGSLLLSSSHNISHHPSPKIPGIWRSAGNCPPFWTEVCQPPPCHDIKTKSYIDDKSDKIMSHWQNGGRL